MFVEEEKFCNITDCGKKLTKEEFSNRLTSAYYDENYKFTTIELTVCNDCYNKILERTEVKNISVSYCTDCGDFE